MWRRSSKSSFFLWTRKGCNIFFDIILLLSIVLNLSYKLEWFSFALNVIKPHRFSE